MENLETLTNQELKELLDQKGIKYTTRDGKQDLINLLQGEVEVEQEEPVEALQGEVETQSYELKRNVYCNGCMYTQGQSIKRSDINFRSLLAEGHLTQL